MKRGVLIFIIVLCLLVGGVNAFMFDWFTVLFSDNNSIAADPIVINTQADPIKVRPGDNLRIIVEVEYKETAVDSVASFNHEKGSDDVQMSLVSSDKKTNRQVYVANWIVHDTLDQIWYTTDYVITFSDGQQVSGFVDWQDPTVSHAASQVSAGTFQNGTYAFPNAVTAGGSSVTINAAGVDLNSGGITFPGGTTMSSSALDCKCSDTTTSAAGTGSRTATATLTGANYVRTGGGCRESANERWVRENIPSGSNGWFCESFDGHSIAQSGTVTAYVCGCRLTS